MTGMHLAAVAFVLGAGVTGCTHARNSRRPRSDAAASAPARPHAAPEPTASTPIRPPDAVAAPRAEAAGRPWQREEDWRRRRAVLAALRPSLMINQWCDDCDLQIALHSRRPAPADFDLTVWACAGGREWELARITVRAGEPVAEYFELDVERLEGFLERVRKDPRVSVVMRPAAGGASDWRREVWYPEVVVGWGWY